MGFFIPILLGALGALGLCQWDTIDLLGGYFWHTNAALGLVGMAFLWAIDKTRQNNLITLPTGARLMQMLGWSLILIPVWAAVFIYLGPLLPAEFSIDHIFMSSKYAYEPL